MDISVEPYSAAAPDRSNLQLPQIIKVLRRHVVLIGACTLAAAALGFVYGHSVPKTYTASSSITVEGQRFAIPELQGALRQDNSPDPMPFVHTEVQVLTTRGLVQGVITKLHMDQDAEFNPALRPPSLTDQAKSWIASLVPKSPSTGGAAAGPDESVLNSVQKAFGVFQDNRSLVIAMSFTAENPRLAASFLNTLTTDYIQGRATMRADANRGADDTLTVRIAEAKAGLDAIENQMRDLRSRGDIVALRAGTVGQQQVEELASAAAKASVDRTQIEATYNKATSLSKQGSSDALAGVLDSPTISQLRGQETTAASKLAQLGAYYGSDHPKVRQAAAELASVKSQLAGETNRIIASLGAQLKVSRDKEADLQKQLATARTTSVKGENAHAQLDQLQQEAGTRRDLYKTLLEREQQTVAQPVATQTPDVRVLSLAVPPGAPSGPNVKMIVGMSGLSGTILGCLIALLRIGSVDGFESPADVTRETGLPVLGTIRRGLARRGMANRVLAAPHGPEVEALRALRGRLRFTRNTGAPRCVLFTSALHAGDADDVAAAFARTAAASGEHVLLVEADLENPVLARMFTAPATGLAAVLQGSSDWRSAVMADPRGPLDLLLGGQKVASGAQAMLSGAAMQNLIVEARQIYDLVVLAGPQAKSPDCVTLGQRADVTVLVLGARSGLTARQAATRLREGAISAVTALLVA